MTETAVPNKSKMTKAVNILGAAEGLRPSADMLANPPAAIMAHGPNTATVNTINNSSPLPSVLIVWFLHYDKHIVMNYLYDTFAYRNFLLIYKHFSSDQKA